jgi:hypothetical protein
MRDPLKFVLWLYGWVAATELPEDGLTRVIQEYSFPDINKAAPIYFNSSSFRPEWLT